MGHLERIAQRGHAEHPSAGGNHAGLGLRGAQSPLGITGEPEDIAYAMLYLAVDAAKFVTGQVVRPNGGVVM